MLLNFVTFSIKTMFKLVNRIRLYVSGKLNLEEARTEHITLLMCHGTKRKFAVQPK